MIMEQEGKVIETGINYLDYKVYIESLPSLNPDEGRRQEQEYAQRHEKTPIQIIQAGLADIEVDKMAMVKKFGENNSVGQKLIDIGKTDLAGKIMALTPEALKMKSSEQSFNETEKKLNDIGLSMKSPDGKMHWENAGAAGD
jgi:hypothetical protein